MQQSFDKRLLFLACRHHIFEIYAAAVFDAFFISRGPEIDLFSRFKSQWQVIDKSKFEPLGSDDSGPGCLDDSEKIWLDKRRHDVVQSLQKHLENVQPREDYREFARLTLWLLGENVTSDFSAPGAYHRARWMAKGIYCLKILGFRHQFKLSKRDLDALRRICVFVCTVYASFWFVAPVAASAPLHDLAMLKLAEDYSKVDNKISQIILSKMRLHLWYLSEDLAAVTLFSPDASNEEKEAIVNALQREPFPEDVRRLAPNNIVHFKGLSVAQFVTSRSLNLFQALGLSQQFLTSPVATWSDQPDYVAASKIVHALKVVNDCAERAVKLATDFNEVLTKNDDQRQLLYQVVEHHRKLVPTNATKQQLIYL